MTMPVSLVLERHGESESNKAKSLYETGTNFADEGDLMRVHTSERRLTAKGVRQAIAAGNWLRNNWYDASRPDEYRLYVSPYVRAMETAGHTGFGDDWRVDARIVERNWGHFDLIPYQERVKKFTDELKLRKDQAFFWRPTDGETLQDVFLRIRDITASLHRDCSDKKVLIVSHGETMWVWRTVLERLMPMELRNLMLSDDDRIWIHNCRLIEYTRLNEDGTLAPRFVRMRFVNPGSPDDPDTNWDWHEIPRRKWSHQDLLEFTKTFPMFIPTDLAESE